MTGKALKVFADLFVEDCQDYQKLKDDLITAYTADASSDTLLA